MYANVIHLDMKCQYISRRGHSSFTRENHYFSLATDAIGLLLKRIILKHPPKLNVCDTSKMMQNFEITLSDQSQ